MNTRSVSRNAPAGPSPFAIRGPALAPGKFADPLRTADGSQRASVALRSLDTLWVNTGTLCNLSCANCYIESSPTNDALVYIAPEEVSRFCDEIEREGLATREIGFTGGEPFMNPGFMEMLADVLGRGFDALVLTNAMRPMRRHERGLLTLREQYGDRLTLRISLDHHARTVHEAERGTDSWEPALDGMRWLSAHDFRIAVAGRMLATEDESMERAGYARLFECEGIAVDAHDPARLVLFPEMDPERDIAEITTDCWDILGKSPDEVMCAASRMVVHRKGEAGPRVVACTLLPHAKGFDLGATLAEASGSVSLNHPHCARFCVLGGASCSA